MDKFIVVPTAYIPDNPAVSAAQGHYNLAHCIQIIPNKFIYPVRHFWNQVGRNGFWIGFNHNQIIVDILATVKKTFDKLKPLCELSCVIAFGQVNIVLPSVEGKPSKPAKCFSHTDGVLFVIGRTRQHGNPLHRGRHARSWLGQGTCCPETKSARTRTLQRELNTRFSPTAHQRRVS